MDNDRMEENYDDNWKDNSTIFVSIPSYRDPETPYTLQSLFSNAKNPQRVTVLVNEQNYYNNPHKGDVNSTNFPGASYHQNRIRKIEQDATEAKGPVVARAQIEQELYDPGEANYWLQVDSHMTFVKAWDTQMIEQHNLLPNPQKSILTMFPDDYDRRTRKVKNLSLPSYIGFHDFDPERLLPTQQRYQYKQFPQQSRKSLFFAAGFSFGPAEIVENVPYDGSLEYLFLGEETSMAARLFTHGVDMYNPKTMLAYHISDRSYRPLYWEQFYNKYGIAPMQDRIARKKKEKESLKIVQDLLFHGTCPASGCGLGNERTLQDYYQFVGINLRERQACSKARLGISDGAPEQEWKEKYGTTKTNWVKAMQSLTPLTASKEVKPMKPYAKRGFY